MDLAHDLASFVLFFLFICAVVREFAASLLNLT
jgi:hypothetical protein